MENVMVKDKVELLLDFIMKNCLWQFHSRAWDRQRQNENIMNKTMQILCEEAVEKEKMEDRCYWVDAVYLVDNFKLRYPWIKEMDKSDIKIMIQELKERLDYLLITGSLNAELTDPHY